MFPNPTTPRFILLTPTRCFVGCWAASGRRGFAVIVERLPCFCRSVVLVRDTEARQDLFAMCGLDGAR
jgi:hypothetical protein